MATIEKELMAVTKVARKADEADQAYFRRLFNKANTMADTEWGKLSDASQKWVNAASKAVDEKTSIPSFNGEVGVEVEAGAEAAEKVNGSGAVSEKKAKKAKTAVVAAPEKKAASGKKTAKPTVGKSPPVKAKADGKAASAKGTKVAAGRGRKGAYPLDAKIKLSSKENPHRKASKDFAKFKALGAGVTVAEAIKGGADWGYLRYAVSRELIAIG